MKTKKIRAFITLFTLMTILVTMTGLTTVNAAGNVSARILGFDGSTSDLRSSQLLQVETEGFSDKAKLRYSYSTDIAIKDKYMIFFEKDIYTNFYAYQTHDMLNSKFDRTENGSLKSDYKYFAVSTRVWNDNKAYIMSDEELKNKYVSVTVQDTNIFSPTYGKKATATYKGLLQPDLNIDMSTSVAAIFEGDKVDVVNILGNAGVTHIGCENSKIFEAKTSDKNIASVVGDSNNHVITGVKSGETTINLKVSKSERCAMHAGKKGKTTTEVRVFKKPVAKADITTIKLNKLEKGVKYTINGETKVCQNPAEPLVWTGLTPNTNYTLNVEATHTHSNKKLSHTAYYSTDIKTLEGETPAPDMKANINVKCGDEFISLKTIYPDMKIFELVSKKDGSNYQIKGENGNYMASIKNAGEYFIRAGEKVFDNVVFDKKTNTYNLQFYKITYDALGGTGLKDNTYYVEEGQNHTVVSAPEKDGYKFGGWKEEQPVAVTYAADSVMPEVRTNKVLKATWNPMAEYSSNYAYIYGYSDTQMAADKELLRCEISVMIHRLVKQNNKDGYKIVKLSKPMFNDVTEDWFRSGMEFLGRKNAYNVNNGNVYPYASVKRGEAFKLICIGLDFAKNSNLPIENYANILFDAGFIEGDENGNLNLDKDITRAEFCKIYNLIIGRDKLPLVTKAGEKVTAETYGFKDLDPSCWYYEIVLKATSSYDAEGYVDLQLREQRNVLDDYN